jgi:hypothetical protein
VISVEYLEQQRVGAATDYLLSLLQHKPASQRARADSRVPKPIVLVINRNAEIALGGLKPKDYKAAQLSIHRLRVSPPVLTNVNDQKIANSITMYLRHVGDDLTILISVVPGEIVVEDVFARSRLPQILRETGISQ